MSFRRRRRLSCRRPNRECSTRPYRLRRRNSPYRGSTHSDGPARTTTTGFGRNLGGRRRAGVTETTGPILRRGSSTHLDLPGRTFRRDPTSPAGLALGTPVCPRPRTSGRLQQTSPVDERSGGEDSRETLFGRLAHGAGWPASWSAPADQTARPWVRQESPSATAACRGMGCSYGVHSGPTLPPLSTRRRPLRVLPARGGCRTLGLPLGRDRPASKYPPVSGRSRRSAWLATPSAGFPASDPRSIAIHAPRST